MNQIAVANETIRITERGCYEVNGKTVSLPALDYRKVLVITPKQGAAAVQAFRQQEGDVCRFEVTHEDSFTAARALGGKPLVMNFANAHHAGGGFRLGANAQEEALCRCSTLYASISSPKASEMYRYNNTHVCMVESDYMLLSPNVLVFRNASLELLAEPFTAGVITVPAPNKRGAAMFAPAGLVEETMLRRIRILLLIAADNRYRNLVLGAWGCGAFGNKPQDVAEYFRKVLINEGYGRLFDEVRFAIYGPENGNNITWFRKVFCVK